MSEPTEDSVRSEVRAWLKDNWNPALGLVEWRLKLCESGWGAPYGNTRQVVLTKAAVEKLEAVLGSSNGCPNCPTKIATVDLTDGSRHVSPQTRERVLSAMRELGYRPNSAARALATGRTRTVGVIALDTALYGPASTLFGIERAAHEAGYFITVVSPTALDRESVLEAVGRLRTQGVDGILAIAPEQESADALLHVHRVPRHVEMNEAAGDLQVDALAAGARGHQKARAILMPEGFDFLEALPVRLAAPD